MKPRYVLSQMCRKRGVDGVGGFEAQKCECVTAFLCTGKETNPRDTSCNGAYLDEEQSVGFFFFRVSPT